MKNITKIDETLTKIELGTKTIYLLGTAHVSHESVDRVKSVINEYQPKAVAVELCAPRLTSLQDPDRWRNMDIIAVMRQGKIYVLLAQILLAGIQKKLADKFKIKPGAEMLAAVNEAESTGAKLILADREVKTTLKRTWAAMGFWTTAKLIISATFGIQDHNEITEAEIERLKSSDALAEVLKEFSKEMPEVQKALIDERDQYLAQKIQESDAETIVAVVGAGHTPGILNYLGTTIDLAPLEKIPPPGWLAKAFSWGFPAIIVGFLIYGFFGISFDSGAAMVKAWIVITGVTAAIGAIICLAHPLTIVAAFVSAPITTLHPLLASGWIAGFVEALVRKPKVSDLEALADDITSVKGLWKNRFSRVLLIVAFTNLCGMVGMVIGTKVLARLVAG